MEQSIIEWMQGTFQGVNISNFKQLFDGEIQVHILSQVEPEIWNKDVSSPQKRRPSFIPSIKNADKKLQPVLNRGDKVKNFKILAAGAERYFKEKDQ